MCGIAGFVALPSHIARLPSAEILERMTDAIAHRGPDSRGIWYDAEHGVGLGHRRLAIRDLSPNGHQPMISSCSRFVIVYNGEIYSHLEIARDLVATRRKVRGTSDTAIMLKHSANGASTLLCRVLSGCLLSRSMTGKLASLL